MVASVTTCVNSVTRSVTAFDDDVNVIANVKLNVSVEDASLTASKGGAVFWQPAKRVVFWA